MTTAEPKLRLRQSHAVLFDKCPHSLYLARQVPDYDTHAQARGTIFHEFARRVLAECQESGQVAIDIGYARDLMTDVVRTCGLPISAEEHDTLLGLATEFAATREFDVRNLVDTEEQYEVEVLGVVITGRPDRVDIEGSRADITDYKTGWAIDPDAKVKGTAQGRIYARMLFNEYPQLATVRLLWDHPRWGGDPKEAVVTRDDLPDIDAYLASLVTRYVRCEAGLDEWAASPGSWCQWCPDKTACPIPKQYRHEGAIETHDDAIKAGELILALDALRKETMKGLRAYSDANGPFDVGDMEFAFAKRADSWEALDRDALRNAMETGEAQIRMAVEAGLIEPDAVIDLDWLSHFKPRKGYTEFKPRKKKEPRS